MAKRFAPLTQGMTAIAVREAAVVLGETERNLRKQIAAGRYRLLAGPQARIRVLLPTVVVEDHERRQRQAGGSANTSPPTSKPPLVRYAMTSEEVARVAEAAALICATSITRMCGTLEQQYTECLAAQERAVATQRGTIAGLETRVARAEERAEREAHRYRELQEKLVALVEAHASRSLVGQVSRLLQGE